jgi:hypothetical protein
MAESDLTRGAAGCTREGVQFAGVQWSPDGQTLAVLGHSRSDFVAFTDMRARQASVFAAPLGSGSCFIAGRIEWSSRQAVVPFFGPDCGLGPNGLSNVLALVDPLTGKLDSYAAITRKGFLKISGRWVAIITVTNETKATTFFSLDDPTVWKTIPLSGLADYCCAP